MYRRYATITEDSGYVGYFITKVMSGRMVQEIHHGATIIATGAEEYKPAEYLYGQDGRVMTNLELEEKITKKDEQVTSAQNLVMIQCVGCRQPDRNYCARICCSQSMKNALKLKELNPRIDITILFRDMRTYGLTQTLALSSPGTSAATTSPVSSGASLGAVEIDF